MGKFLKDSTAARLLTSLAFTESLPPPRKSRSRRVIRSVAGSTMQWVKVVSGEEAEYVVIKIINSLDQTEVPGDNTPLLLLPAVPALDLEEGDILNCQLVSPSTDADKVYTPINNVFLR